MKSMCFKLLVEVELRVEQAKSMRNTNLEGKGEQ